MPSILRLVTRRRYLALLAAVFALLWTALAIDPFYRQDWALENALVVVFVVALAATYRALPLSGLSYTMIFLFLCLHTVGAHYTYAEVPYDAWWRTVFGASLNEAMGWERNHFDRLVHLLYGLLLAYPVREVFLRVAAVRGFWGYFLPLTVTMSTSMIFELFEWGAAEIFGGDLGVAYLGIQGDMWDAQKDMALASLGALLAMGATATLNAYFQRDFAAEWNKSLSVKRRTPLGEVAFRRLWRRKNTK